MSDPFYCASGLTLYLGDCIEVMRSLPEASVDAIVTDPPYGLEFMGKDWDAPWKAAGDVVGDPASVGGFQDGNGGNPYSRSRIRYGVGIGFQQWCEAWAREAYRVLKPGGHIAAFGGTRTHHRLVCGIEDAGFEIRDEADWMYGSGFPKSLDVSKAIDRAAGALKPEGRAFSVAGIVPGMQRTVPSHGYIPPPPATDAAREWQGWGTALKPAHEPICLARKPLIGTVVTNVLRYGTGAINIDGTRIGAEGPPSNRFTDGMKPFGGGAGHAYETTVPTSGRWPANVLLDEEAAALLDATVGEAGGGFGANTGRPANVYGTYAGLDGGTIGYGDRGGPSRFFYTAKASRSEREAGLEDLPLALRTDGRPPEGPGADNPRLRVSERRNDHPTVKPVSLMRWLCKLITPPGGVVLDPFLGSGTTGMAALDEGFQFIGIDMTERYVEIARYRVTHRHVLEVEVKESDEGMPQGRLF